MKYDPVERKRLLGGIFATRQCWDNSAKGGCLEQSGGLESVKKTPQVATGWQGVWRPALFFNNDPATPTPIRICH